MKSAILSLLLLMSPFCFANSATQRCEQFLQKYVPFAEHQLHEIPLQIGTLAGAPPLLSSSEAVRSYLWHTRTPWRAELLKAASEVNWNDEVVFLSEFGPTLWSKERFESWRKVTEHPALTDNSRAYDLIMKLARGESVHGFSKQSHQRIRNAFLASLEGEMAQLTVRVRSFKNLAAKPQSASDEKPKTLMERLRNPTPEILMDPLTGLPVDFSRVDPENRILLEMLTYNLMAHRERAQVAEEMRHNSPSLRVEFRLNTGAIPRLMGPPNFASFLTPESHRRMMWVARILAREALVRRKLVIDGDRLKRLGDVVDDDQIFLYAAHPETLPFWFCLKHGGNVRDYELQSGYDVFTLPSLSIHPDGDRCHFFVSRGEWNDDTTDEYISFEMTVAVDLPEGWDYRDMEPHERERVTNWVRGQWDRYSSAINVNPNPRPDVTIEEHVAKLDFAGHLPARVIGFYVWLQGRYATLLSPQQD